MGEYGPMSNRTSTLSLWRFAVAGVLTAVVGLAVSTGVAWSLRMRTTPVVAVAESVRDLVPGDLATWLVHLVGSWDKPLLMAGTVLGLLGACVVAGLLTRRHPWWADLLIVGLGGLALVAVVARGGIASGLSAVAGLVAMLVSLRAMVAPLSADLPTDTARRAFFTRMRWVAVGAATVAAAGRFAGRGRRQVEESRRLLRVPGSRGVVPQGAQVSVDGVAAWRTPNAAFYRIDTALAPPVVAPQDWQLRVHGMVDHEVRFTYDELLRMTPSEQWVTLACVSNEVGGDLIGNAWWTGVPVRTVLERAGVDPNADAVLQTSVDGWTCVTPLQALIDERDSLLAYAMNGQPLEVEHGFPVRVVVPGLYGYVSATKWVTSLEVTRFDRAQGYWTPRGWSAQGPVKTQSRIDVPADGARVPAGRVSLGGVAWAQHVGIERVEVAVDSGEWTRAKLGRVPSADTWVQWATVIDVEAGSHEISVRATDHNGVTQTAKVRDVLPDGATGHHSITITAE